MYSKALIFAAAVACVMAADAPAPKTDERVKKDVLLGTYPYTYAAVPATYTIPTYQAYDDGKYYPGKYEKTYVAPAVRVAPAVTTYAAHVPVTHYASVPAVHYPYVAGYPYVKSYVY